MIFIGYQVGEVVRLDPTQGVDVLYTALGSPDVVTAEKEQIDPSLLGALQAFCPARPNPAAFSAIC